MGNVCSRTQGVDKVKRECAEWPARWESRENRGSKEAACEASKCVAAHPVSFSGDGDGGTKEERDTSEGVTSALA